MRKSPSGSPQSWALRRKAYRQTAKQVSNPGQPSPCNRKARRTRVMIDKVVDDVADLLFPEAPTDA